MTAILDPERAEKLDELQRVLEDGDAVTIAQEIAGALEHAEPTYDALWERVFRALHNYSLEL